MPEEPKVHSATTLNEEAPALPTEQRLKLARSILDRTCIECGAGYVLLMFVPGSDQVLRAFRGLDTPQECIAAAAEVAGMLKLHIDALNELQRQKN